MRTSCSTPAARRRSLPPFVGRALPRLRRGLRGVARSALHARRARRCRVAHGGTHGCGRIAAALRRHRRGGFFTTGSDAEALVVRVKDLFDDATPSANSLAASGLLRLAALTGAPSYEAPAIAILEMLARPMATHPTAFAHLLSACERAITPPIEIAIVGPQADAHTQALRRVVASRADSGVGRTQRRRRRRHDSAACRPRDARRQPDRVRL